MQFELCRQAGEQIANKQIVFNYRRNRFPLREYIRVLQILSCQPVLQLQTFGYVQFPFTHDGEHIAKSIRIEM